MALLDEFSELSRFFICNASQQPLVPRKIKITPTDAVRLLYRQIAIRREFPLELKVPNELTAKTLDQTDRGLDMESFASLEDFKKSWQ